MAEADRRRVAAACALLATVYKGRGGRCSQIKQCSAAGRRTQAAGDDFRAVLGEDEGVNERQIHGGARQAQRAAFSQTRRQ